MKLLFDLFITFCKVGGLTFGGGYAMLPMLQKEIVENKKWATEDEILDYYAVGQCTPGIIAINTATFVGQKVCGIKGAIFATAGVVFPSLIIILILAAFLKNIAEIELVQKAFAGIRICVSALILSSIIKLWKSGIKDYIGIIIFAIAFSASIFLNLSPVIIVIAAAFIGVFVKKVGGKK